MNTTQIKWNTDIPSFDLVGGKRMIVEYKTEFNQNKTHTFNLTSDQHRVWFGFGAVDIRYAVLTDEPVFCEYKINPDNIDVYISSCGKYNHIHVTEDWKLCPYCSNPIKIIEEVKPMALLGVTASIVCQDGVDGHLWEYQWLSNGTIIKSNSFRSKQECITAWNDFVSRMTGEK